MSEPQLTGLTTAEVADRVSRGLVNRSKRSDFADYMDIVRRNVVTLFNIMVTPAAIALFALGEIAGGVAVSMLAVINTLVSLVHEIQAKRNLDKLTILVETKARVLRDGATAEIPAGDVVKDDVVLVSNGEAVIADGPVLDSKFLEVDEALLTGESDPIRKKVGDQLLSGSYAVAGDGAYRAEKVGTEAFAQKTSAEARTYSADQSPLQHVINTLVAILTYTAVALTVAYFAAYLTGKFAGAGDEKSQQTELVKLIAITVTSMVPQGLVLTATMAFSLGAVVMSRRGAIVQRITAVESMAAVDTICTDKTGTLTTNNLKLEGIRPLGPDLTQDTVRNRLRQFASASVDTKNKSLQAIRAEVGATPVELIDTLPFKSQNRYSAVRIKNPGGPGELVLALGAVEALGKHLADPAAVQIPDMTQLMQSGLRLLLFAESDRSAAFDGSLEGFALRPVALLTLSDELRPEAADVLKQFTAQGIAFKIISGDNPETVKATMGALDIPASKEPVVSGDQLASAPNKTELILTRSVFGRVAPNQKVEIVKTLKENGRYVAMIGDGVNDILPIKAAHLGIAMGDGSSASKTVSGLVLENNNFALLPETLEEGRTIVRNLRRSAKLFLTKNVYALFLLVLGAFGVFGLSRPFEPQQVTLLNWMTIGIPAFVIALSRERSTSATKPNFLREVGWFALRTGLVFALAGIAVQLIAVHHLEAEERVQRTMLLSVLTLLGLTSLLRALTDGEHTPLKGDTMYQWFAAAAVPVYLMFMYSAQLGMPFIAQFFRLSELSSLEWGLVVAVAGPAWLLSLASDRIKV